MRIWLFQVDMNYDGAVTISDAWLWVKWLFFYPGDWVFSSLMDVAPPIARFLELNSNIYGGFASGVISVIVWWIGLLLLFALIDQLNKPGQPSSAFEAILKAKEQEENVKKKD